MFIVQTYFSNEIAERADVFVYYVELPGNNIQYREIVIESFRELGTEYGASVSLFFPDMKSVARIRFELERELKELFGIATQEPPCIVISPKVIGNTAGRKDWIYFSLKDRSEISLEELTTALRDCIESIKAGSKNTRSGHLQRFWQSVELKPGVMGIRLDLKKLFNG